MDYELTLDLTEAATQAYATNINQLLTAIIPSFCIHEREKFFSSIQITMNLNTASLPNSAILPTLQDLNNTKPTNLAGILIQCETAKKRASMNAFLQQQKEKNQKHRNVLKANNFNHSSFISSPTSSLSSPGNNHKNKNKLVSTLPSPAYPNYQNNYEWTPPPSYSSTLCVAHSQNGQKNDDEKECEFMDEDEKYAKELQSKYDKNEKKEDKVDEDYAFALSLQQQQNVQDEDMKIALELQREEKMKVEYARNRLNEYQRNNEQQMMNEEGFESVNNVQNMMNDALFRRLISAQMHGFDIAADDDEEENKEVDNDENDIWDELLLYGHHHHGHGYVDMDIEKDESWKDLPIRTLKKKDVEILKKSEDKKTCSICMTEFEEGDVLRILPCFHEFHKDCVDQWFRQQNDKNKDVSCPLDRKKIKEIAHQRV